ncbi:MAG: rod shape-determining protein MreC [Candidatus Firestonebacteria bacterium RIFOXYA2_FULL_40_8]|nr:MAG: rod shape-determining protein MreC [Candidatus Firestonebacteria bacterium RIFOXYA2_FULL_40_8]
MWKKLFNKYRVYVILLLILVVSAGLFFFFKGKEQGLGKSRAVSEVVYALQKPISKLGNAAEYIWNVVIKFAYLKYDNEKLNKELSTMAYQSNQLVEAEKENERLKKLLDYKRKVSYKTNMAKVVGRDLSNYFGIITVDLGERDGVVVDMPVITPEGVVGKIIEVYPEYSLVMLLTDYKSGISGIIQKPRPVGTVTGAGNGMCKMMHLSVNEEVKAGDYIVTSGIGKFPKGLLIGKITDVRPASDSMSLDIDVVPSVNVLKLEEVLIVFKE